MRTLRAFGRFEEANDAIDHMLALVPRRRPDMEPSKLTICSRLERYREAAQAAEQALRLTPQISTSPTHPRESIALDVPT